ncbi:MAG: phosphotransferase [Nitrospinae bacterium]|nr:phosphotransferase [Nitrospinota bacterium]
MASLTFEDIEENFRFAVLEVIRQVEDVRTAVGDPSHAIISRVRDRDDYIDNLKSVIENRGFSHIIQGEGGDRRKVDFFRAFLTITGNLEKIGDYAVNIVGQLTHLSDPRYLGRFDYRPFFDAALTALGKVGEAVYQNDIGAALAICQAELTLDELYKGVFTDIRDRLMAGGGECGDLITSLFIFQYLERMGDALLNIGEAVIFAVMGERIKIRELRALEGSLTDASIETPLPKLHYQGIWGSRSGCRIGAVNRSDGEAIVGADDDRNVIFKYGGIEKLTKEKESLDRWSRIAPGLAPTVKAFQTEEDAGALLLEYLVGATLQEIFVNGDEALFQRAFAAFQETALRLWAESLTPTPVSARFVSQMRRRLPEVYRLHPDFDEETKLIGPVVAPTVGDLLEQSDTLDDELAAPFSIFIHGDFNVNNVIYNADEERIRYLDLHRSGYSDYVQDVSVFIVSLFRLPVFDPHRRERLDGAILRFYTFAREFAAEKGDTTFDARLALGLARSFITSTRFEYRTRFARRMYLRGTYLLTKLVAHRETPWSAFSLSKDAMTY